MNTGRMITYTFSVISRQTAGSSGGAPSDRSIVTGSPYETTRLTVSASLDSESGDGAITVPFETGR